MGIFGSVHIYCLELDKDKFPSYLVVEMVKNVPAMQETCVPALGQEDALEKETTIALKYSCLETPWTEEPGGLQSMGSQRVGHDN